MSLSLERRAALWGDRTAVVDASDDQRVSYAELDAAAEAAARRLAELGVGANDAVAVLSRNRIEVLALLFAARRLGAVFAPVSHRLTPATVEGPLDAISPDLLVHESAQRDLVREVPDDRAYDFEEFGRLDGVDYDRPDSDPETSLCYLHTRDEADRPAVGASRTADRRDETTTDDPQAGERVVDVPARAVEWNCLTLTTAWGLGRRDRALSVLPLSDPDGLLRTALPLLYVGGRVVLSRAFDPPDALDAMEREGATFCLAGATEYRELVADEGFEGADLDGLDFAAARTALPADVREALAQRAPVVRTYATVETGANCYVPPERTDETDSDCVGRPFPDCELRVVDAGEGEQVAIEDEERGEDGRRGSEDEVADGEVGDLEVRGPVVASGYLNAAEPFPEWVATGDVAYREDGDYYILGRSGQELRAGSERLHPRLVERVLERHGNVSAAGVIGEGDDLRAMVVGATDSAEIRAFAHDHLPEAAVPREITVVEELPRRPTGDVDRAKLRQRLDD